MEGWADGAGEVMPLWVLETAGIFSNFQEFFPLNLLDI